MPRLQDSHHIAQLLLRVLSVEDLLFVELLIFVVDMDMVSQLP